MLLPPFYDPQKTYEENFEQGPFGIFTDGKVYTDSGEPAYTFLGHLVHLPFGIPAGPLVNGKFIKAALDKGFDVTVYKTVRSKKYPCNDWPNVVPLDLADDLTAEIVKTGVKTKNEYTEPLSITNSFGVPSFDPDFWQKDMAEAVEHARGGQVVVGSFQGTLGGSADNYIRDFALTARLVKETGAKIMEVNLSCPNEGTHHLLCFDLKNSQLVLNAIKMEVGNVPLIVKITYFDQPEQLEKFVKAVGDKVQGIAAINTIGAPIYDANGNQALPGQGRLYSGVAGQAIKWAGLEMVKRLAQIRQNFGFNYTIIGGGGVMNFTDYKEYLDAGADAVMSATGAMWNPLLAQEIKNNVIPDKIGNPAS